jgi:hypothetical protein
MIRSCLSPLPIHLQNFLAACGLAPLGGAVVLFCFVMWTRLFALMDFGTNVVKSLRSEWDDLYKNY